MGANHRRGSPMFNFPAKVRYVVYGVLSNIIVGAALLGAPTTSETAKTDWSASGGAFAVFFFSMSYAQVLHRAEDNKRK